MIGLMVSCVTQRTTGNGAYSDLSLNVESDKYEIKRLEPINANGSALFGIPNAVDKKRGMVFRFNGVEIPKTGQFLPVMSLLGYTIATAITIHPIFFDYSYFSPVDPVQSIVSTVIAFPVAGAINNLIYPNAASSVASLNLNRELLENNRDIDVFLNPKYEISFNNSLFGQKASIVGNVMGARLLVNDYTTNVNDIIPPKKETLEVKEDEIQKFKYSKLESKPNLGDVLYFDDFYNPDQKIKGKVVGVFNNTDYSTLEYVNKKGKLKTKNIANSLLYIKN